MYFKNINTSELKKILDEKEEILLLDVRTEEEFDILNIETSVNVPLMELLYNVDEIEPYKEKKVVVYCRSGHRSITACNLLYMEGFRNLYNLDKGIIDFTGISNL